MSLLLKVYKTNECIFTEFLDKRNIMEYHRIMWKILHWLNPDLESKTRLNSSIGFWSNLELEGRTGCSKDLLAVSIDG